jgi:hypothetical protein
MLPFWAETKGAFGKVAREQPLSKPLVLEKSCHPEGPSRTMEEIRNVDLLEAAHPEILEDIVAGEDISDKDFDRLEIDDIRRLVRSVGHGTPSPGTASHLLLILLDILKTSDFDEVFHELFIWCLTSCPPETIQEAAQILAVDLQDSINSLLFVDLFLVDHSLLEQCYQLPVDRFLAVIDVIVKSGQIANHRVQIIEKLFEKQPASLDILCGLSQLDLTDEELSAHGIHDLLDIGLQSSNFHHVAAVARFFAAHAQKGHPLNATVCQFMLSKMTEGSTLEKGEMAKLVAASLGVLSPAQCAEFMDNELIERICELLGAMASPHIDVCCFQILRHLLRLDARQTLAHLTPDDIETIDDIAINGSEETQRRLAQDFAEAVAQAMKQVSD